MKNTRQKLELPALPKGWHWEGVEKDKWSNQKDCVSFAAVEGDLKNGWVFGGYIYLDDRDDYDSALIKIRERLEEVADRVHWHVNGNPDDMDLQSSDALAQMLEEFDNYQGESKQDFDWGKAYLESTLRHI